MYHREMDRAWERIAKTTLGLGLGLLAMVSACAAPIVAPKTSPPPANAPTCRDGDLGACGAGCDQNDGESCFLLGAASEEGKLAKKDPERAATLYRRACDLGFGTACGELAVMMLDGVIAGAPQKAASLCEKGCAANSAAACALLGSMYQEGSGVEADASLAAKFYQRGCELGEAHGCSALGYLYLDGRGVPHDESKGKALVEKGCQGGDGDACKVLPELSKGP